MTSSDSYLAFPAHVADAVVNSDLDSLSRSDYFDLFEFVGNTFLADPSEEFHEGVELMAVIKDVTDNTLYGLPYYLRFNEPTDPFYDMEGHVFEASNGIKFYLFKPLVPFDYRGYTVL